MKTWIKRSLIGVFGASLLFGGAFAFANHRMHHHRGMMSDADIAQMRGRIIDKVSRELALDSAQQARLNSLADAVQAQRAALRAPAIPGAVAASNPRAELQALVAGPQFDRSRAQAVLDAKTAAVHDKAPAVLAAAADFFDALKPEQQQKVRELMARGGHHGWGRG